MKKSLIPFPVDEAVEQIKSFLLEKEFRIFAEIDHHANAKSVELDMPKSCVLIFGNPSAGTKLMQKDIFMSFDMPLRLAVVEKEGQTYLLYNTVDDYAKQYDVEGHPVLEKIEGLFSALTLKISNN